MAKQTTSPACFGGSLKTRELLSWTDELIEYLEAKAAEGKAAALAAVEAKSAEKKALAEDAAKAMRAALP